MRKRELWRCAKFVLLLVAIISGAGTAAAETSSSAHYQVSETEFGATSNQQSCSGQYCARASIGDMTEGGDSKSPTSTAKFGSLTDSDPLLEVIVDPGLSDLGVLSTESTAFKTTTVRVRNYLSDGYTLQIVGNPPKFGDHTLNTLASPTSSTPGTEQFGINATDNSTPDVGADPLQVPSSQTSFGVVNDNYKIQNKFKYVSGDEVARSESESGRTDYTISMMVNVSNSTPAGHYTGDFSVVVIPVY
jgi:hypothetical protein